MSAKELSIELKKSNADIRKILSNLYKEGKILKVAYGQYSRVNISANITNESVNTENELIKKARTEYQKKRYAEIKRVMNAYQREYYRKHREEKRAYSKRYYAEHIEKMREFNRKYYALYPERRKEYTRRYWLKKAQLSQKHDRNTTEIRQKLNT